MNTKPDRSEGAILAAGSSPSPATIAMLALIGVPTVWTFWPSLAEMARTWSDDPRYSHGYLVAPFALFLLWHRRASLVSGACSWWGLPPLLVGTGLGLAGARYYLPWFEGVALLPTLLGVALLVGGRPAGRWAWPAIAFLFFMIPLPHRVEGAVGPPLQRLATVASTYLLQAAGLPAQAEGNVIVLEDVRIGVIEACNGLGMLMMFFAYATAVAILIRRPIVDRLCLLLSAAPIALAANVLRIVTTGLLHSFSTRAIAEHVYHDLAGWLMMPIALAMFGVELVILSHLLIPAVTDEIGRAPGLRSGVPGSPLPIDPLMIARNTRDGRRRR